MKTLTAFFSLLVIALPLRSQTAVQYEVILPADTTQAMPVIYAFNYGAADGAYLAAQLRYIKALPPVAIVMLHADMDHIGLIYKTGQLTDIGKDVLESIEKNIMPSVESRFRFSGFRIYLGHSYTASYANYLIQYKPALFNGYILLAPEKTGIDYTGLQRDEFSPSPFKLDNKTREVLHRRKTFYYAAVGEYDEPRRHRYAREPLKTLEQAGVTCMYDSIPRANHLTILTFAIQPALEFIFQLYGPETGRALLQQTYGVSPARWFSHTYAQHAKDSTDLKAILAAFDTTGLTAGDYTQFGHYCVRAGLPGLAERYYQRAISLLPVTNNLTDRESGLLCDIYVSLAGISDHTTGWEYIQRALPFAARLYNTDVYYNAGKFAIDRQYKLKEGLMYLRKFIDQRRHTIDDIHVSLEAAYVLAGKGYLLQKNKADAKAALEKALAINAFNREALELMEQVQEFAPR